jgi:hypothetical protein
VSKKLITLTAQFAEAVKEYQKANKIKSWTEALLRLAALGYEYETGQQPPEPYLGWGGWRGNEASLKALMEYADRVSDKGRNDPAESGE